MRSSPALLRALPAVLATVLLAVPSAAAFRLGTKSLGAPARNPADALGGVPADEPAYDRATHCTRKRQPGMVALQAWLARHVRGVSWGTYRCELWGDHSASLHAEGRAIDWHLDVGRPADRAAARALITTLLAPDAAGTPQALTRRMGIEEIIWDCSYWSTGLEDFRRYSPCFGKTGRPRRHVDRTIAHRNHIHLGMTKLGAAGRTSFWRFLALGSVSRVRDELARTRPQPEPAQPRPTPGDPQDSRGSGDWPDSGRPDPDPADPDWDGSDGYEPDLP